MKSPKFTYTKVIYVLFFFRWRSGPSVLFWTRAEVTKQCRYAQLKPESHDSWDKNLILPEVIIWRSYRWQVAKMTLGSKLTLHLVTSWLWWRFKRRQLLGACVCVNLLWKSLLQWLQSEDFHLSAFQFNVKDTHNVNTCNKKDMAFPLLENLGNKQKVFKWTSKNHWKVRKLWYFLYTQTRRKILQILQTKPN